MIKLNQINRRELLSCLTLRTSCLVIITGNLAISCVISLTVTPYSPGNINVWSDSILSKILISVLLYNYIRFRECQLMATSLCFQNSLANISEYILKVFSSFFFISSKYVFHQEGNFPCPSGPVLLAGRSEQIDR